MEGTTMVNGKYKFSEEEKRGMSGELARKHRDRQILEDEKKSVVAGYQDRLKRIGFDVGRLSRGLVDGYEIRQFECKMEKDYDAHTKAFIDIRTGDVIDTRPLDPMDYQQDIKFTDDQPIAEKPKKSKKSIKAQKGEPLK